jgi:hypothetical protein
MADNYQDRPCHTEAEHDRGAVRGESDALVELVQLSGQSNPIGTAAKTSRPLQSRANIRPQYAAEAEASAPAGSPQWMQRATQEAPPQQEYEEPESQYQPSPVPPLHRYAALPTAASEQDHHEPQQDAGEQHGLIKSVEQENALDPAYSDDPYAHQRGFGRMVAVAAVLALALVGTGATLTYRAYVASPRGGELPIVRADNSATNVVPAQSDGGASKITDRMPPGYGGEKLASRDETSVDVNSSSGASLELFPPLNQNSSPPPVASVSPTGPALTMAVNGTMPNNEPRQIKTLAVRGDPAENGGIPTGAAAPAKPDPTAPSASAPTALAQRNPSAVSPSANAPVTPSAAASDPAPPIRLASTNAVPTARSAGRDYLVQVSSQKNEADVQASYRALQNKFPAALGSRPPVIKRADLGAKGVYYRTMVGPFGSTEEATQFCGNLKSAGGQCVIQKTALP